MVLNSLYLITKKCNFLTTFLLLLIPACLPGHLLIVIPADCITYPSHLFPPSFSFCSAFAASPIFFCLFPCPAALWLTIAACHTFSMAHQCNSPLEYNPEGSFFVELFLPSSLFFNQPCSFCFPIYVYLHPLPASKSQNDTAFLLILCVPL